MKLIALNRKINICIIMFVFVVILAISLVFLNIHFKKNEIKYVNYKENGKVDYNVAVQTNNFYESDVLKQDKQYISELIASINTEFKYDFEVFDEIEYKYNYKIEAYANVIDKDTNKELYSNKEVLLDTKEGTAKGKLNVVEPITLDYNKYNKKINEFVSTYDLKNIRSTLAVKMYINIEGINKEFKKNESVISLEMPLTQNTVSITTKADKTNLLLELSKNGKKSVVFLILAIVLIILDVALLILLLIYSKKTESEEDKYNNELKKILNNYDSYISKVNDEFDTSEYQILRVQNFVDLLEIRDTMQIPIIMIENKETLTSCFIIATPNKLLYFYSLGVAQYALPTGSSDEEKEDVGEVNV